MLNRLRPLLNKEACFVAIPKVTFFRVRARLRTLFILFKPFIKLNFPLSYCCQRLALLNAFVFVKFAVDCRDSALLAEFILSFGVSY